jgi:hypothetical protein
VSNPAALIEQTLKDRLREDVGVGKLAAAIGATSEALVALLVHAALYPDQPQLEVTLKAVPGRKPLTPTQLAMVTKEAVDAARAADPAFFAEVKKRQLAITQPGDQRSADPALKAELAKLLRSGLR